MKRIVLGAVLAFGCFSFDAHAGRRLIVPSMRLRVDGYGSTTTDGVSKMYPTPPTNLASSALSGAANAPVAAPLNVLEARFRFEFSNISSVAQHVTFFARPGTRIGIMSNRTLYGGYDNYNNIYSTTSLASRTQIGSFTLNAYGGASETISTSSQQSIWVSVLCDIPARNCYLACETIDTSGATTSSTSNILTATIDPAMVAILARDTLLELIGNFDFEIAEDRGAVVASVGALGNRSGGNGQVLMQSAGNIALNGGRPF